MASKRRGNFGRSPRQEALVSQHQNKKQQQAQMQAQLEAMQAAASETQQPEVGQWGEIPQEVPQQALSTTDTMDSVEAEREGVEPVMPVQRHDGFTEEEVGEGFAQRSELNNGSQTYSS